MKEAIKIVEGVEIKTHLIAYNLEQDFLKSIDNQSITKSQASISDFCTIMPLIAAIL